MTVILGFSILALLFAFGVASGARRRVTVTRPTRCTPPGRLIDKGVFQDVTRWWEAI